MEVIFGHFWLFWWSISLGIFHGSTPVTPTSFLPIKFTSPHIKNSGRATRWTCVNIRFSGWMKIIQIWRKGANHWKWDCAFALNTLAPDDLSPSDTLAHPWHPTLEACGLYQLYLAHHPNVCFFSNCVRSSNCISMINSQYLEAS